jgi:peptide/nickel transport system permease protein
MLRYIVRRVIYVIPTLILISLATFAIIEAPPGDFLTVMQARLRGRGEEMAQAELEGLRKTYGLDRPIYVRYLAWARGLFRGDFGYSFAWNAPVKDLIFERLGLTAAISLASTLVVWAIAFPVGVYSATHQYSMGDYVLTLVGFLGLATPDFLIALVLLWLVWSNFGLSLGGLFSRDLVGAPWSITKLLDLLKHVWLPVLIVGTAGTAGMIRTMRANLLDELHQPYVITARAKGLHERKVVLKYPIRVALIPFVSTVGWMLPGLISSSTIVSIVLNLETTGPLLLQALLSQDMYIAGSFVLMLSVLTVIGTLVSDILLAWLDPRIRYT